MLCELIKSKIPTHHKDTPRQHSLKKILIMVRLLILSLFPCHKDSKKKYVRNLWVLGYTPFYEKFTPKETDLFRPLSPYIPKTSPDFLAFFPRLRDGTTITALCCACCRL